MVKKNNAFSKLQYKIKHHTQMHLDCFLHHGPWLTCYWDADFLHLNDRCDKKCFWKHIPETTTNIFHSVFLVKNPVVRFSKGTKLAWLRGRMTYRQIEMQKIFFCRFIDIFATLFWFFGNRLSWKNYVHYLIQWCRIHMQYQNFNLAES